MRHFRIERTHGEIYEKTAKSKNTHLSGKMRQANPMMYERYDTFIKHLWDEDKKLQVQKQEAIQALEREKEILKTKEQEVNVLEKHKEHQKEEYIKEEKALELKQLNEIGSQKFFIKNREKQEEQELLEYLEKQQRNET